MWHLPRRSRAGRCVENGAILHTKDGGGIWKNQTSGIENWLSSVGFATPQSGWATGGYGVIVHTEDGGGTWEKQTSGASSTLESIAFPTTESGWAVGKNGVILHTEDGGGTWTKQASGIEAWLFSVAICHAGVGLGGRAKTASSCTPRTAATHGRSRLAASREFLRSVTFPTPQPGWAVGGKGVILNTEDGGRTWKMQTSGVTSELWSVVFPTPQVGWAVGENGTILHWEE